jgi:hypothetical protein
MNRTRVVRALRIAWSVAWGIMAVLVVAAWVRSYWSRDRIVFAQIVIESHTGQMQIQAGDDETFVTAFPPYPGLKLRDGTLWMPHRDSVLLFVTLAAIPWAPSIFTRRTILIATTLVAVGLGLIVWLAR